MAQKKLKDIVSPVILEQYQAGDYKIRVENASGRFVVCIDGVRVESFNTKDAALNTALEVAKELGNDK